MRSTHPERLPREAEPAATVDIRGTPFKNLAPPEHRLQLVPSRIVATEVPSRELLLLLGRVSHLAILDSLLLRQVVVSELLIAAVVRGPPMS
mmetsp:Transcript_7101/g.11471  ORF Transcript_7101/g.11471 Transcript_7101/m.11471 type:complete len:92 (-) Transcript_7101:853-1128(-)